MDDTPPSRHWYGWQPLIVDGIAYSLGTGGLFTQNFALYIALNTPILLGTPIVHWAHGNVGAGFGSLGLRLIPIGVMFYGAYGAGGGVIVAGGLVGLGIVALDAFLFSYETVNATRTMERAAGRHDGPSWSLGFTGTRGGGILSVVGTF
ncbi:MAG: hypothetical protein Q8S73_43715 [Deltaproteobacteria bacterium]|nr:hypothetical protein [Deltaproteobacteria bacterium]